MLSYQLPSLPSPGFIASMLLRTAALSSHSFRLPPVSSASSYARRMSSMACISRRPGRTVLHCRQSQFLMVQYRLCTPPLVIVLLLLLSQPSRPFTESVEHSLREVRVGVDYPLQYIPSHHTRPTPELEDEETSRPSDALPHSVQAIIIISVRKRETGP